MKYAVTLTALLAMTTMLTPAQEVGPTFAERISAEATIAADEINAKDNLFAALSISRIGASRPSLL